MIKRRGKKGRGGGHSTIATAAAGAAGPCIRKCEGGEEVGGRNPGLLCQTVRVGGGGWWLCVLLKVVVVTGVAFTNTSGVRGLRAKNPKPSHYGLVPGLPCQMARVDGGGWWSCISLKVVAVAGVAFANTSRVKGLRAENPKPSARAQFRAASAQLVLKGVAVDGYSNPFRSKLRGVAGLG